MILLNKHSFGVSGHHRKVDWEQAMEPLAQGPVLNVSLAFENWLDSQPLQADAFLDPGADNTHISLRWIYEQANAAGTDFQTPAMNPTGLLLEGIGLVVNGLRLSLGDSERSIWISSQKEVTLPMLPEMSGLEDILLGRDFMTQHKLLVLFDGDHQDFSILAPIDSANKMERQQILEIFDGN